MAPHDVITRAFAQLTATELHEILRLRSDVFVVEQQCAYADVDGRDTEGTTRHHWIEHDGAIIAYARTVADGGAGTAARIGRVVTAPGHRHRGVAARLLADILGGLDGDVVLDAQSYLVDWYRRIGFAPTGPEFLEDGIAHVPMRLTRHDPEPA
ncbi:MAG TPA: GNAT family N-acetyltransferase [Ilumatobacter sp.]